MKDFTKKGTKLPVIPVGTKFKWLDKGEFKEPCTDNKNGTNSEKSDFISFGSYRNDNKIYVICDSEIDSYYRMKFLIKLSTIERLAKEQGMLDDEPMKIGFVTTWTSKSFSNPSNLEYAINKIRLEKEKEALEIASKIIRNTLQSSQSLLKSQQMNPTIKLQENGTVTVTDTVTTTTLSKVTVDEICRLVKEDVEKVKKPNLQLGKWYKVINLQNGCLGFPDIGFFTDEKHTDGICGGIDGFNLKTINGRVWRVNGDFSELSHETVEQYLIEEAVKRGYEKETKYKHIKFDTVEVLKKPENLKLNLDYNNLTDGCGGSIFDDGQWATIIKPETITRAEAEKRYDVKITD